MNRASRILLTIAAAGGTLSGAAVAVAAVATPTTHSFPSAAGGRGSTDATQAERDRLRRQADALHREALSLDRDVKGARSHAATKRGNPAVTTADAPTDRAASSAALQAPAALSYVAPTPQNAYTAPAPSVYAVTAAPPVPNAPIAQPVSPSVPPTTHTATGASGATGSGSTSGLPETSEPSAGENDD